MRSLIGFIHMLIRSNQLTLVTSAESQLTRTHSVTALHCATGRRAVRPFLIPISSTVEHSAYRTSVRSFNWLYSQADSQPPIDQVTLADISATMSVQTARRTSATTNQLVVPLPTSQQQCPSFD